MKNRGSSKLINSDLEGFYDQIIMLLDSGLPLPRGIRRFGREVKNPKFRLSLNRMAQHLEGGESLSEAMIHEKRFFSDDCIALVRAGEKGGNLLDALKLVLDQVYFQNNFRSRISNSVLYPVMVLISTCTLYLINIYFTYPVYMKFYSMTDLRIPWVSRIVYLLYIWSEENIATILALFLCVILISRVNLVRDILHSLWLKIPLLKQVILGNFIASFSKGISILLKAGIPLPESINLLRSINKNRKLISILEKVGNSAEEGQNLPDSLSAFTLFPESYVHAIKTGEYSNQLPETMSELADIYVEESEYHLKYFLQLLDIFLITLAGIFVFFLLMGMYSLYSHYITAFELVYLW